MKKVLITLIALVFTGGKAAAQSPSSFPKERQDAVISVLKKYTGMGLPGVAVAVYSPKTGFWSHAEGFANVEKKIPLTNDHVHYLQSTSKTYMAVAILMLYERGELGLDDPVIKYVREPWLTSIAGSDKITIRMLLNHTSGLPEYSTDPLLVSRIIQDPLTVLGVPELLSYISGKELEYEPGTKYRYRNTNYEILSLVADTITGDHVAFINKEILGRLGLKSTYYLTKNNYQDNMNIVDSYWDVLLEGLPANVSRLQRANVASMKGDDGLVASTTDAVLFMKGLIEGKLVNPSSLVMMQQWVKNEAGEPRYGLGLTYYNLDVTYGIGHSGGGVGAGCVLMYLPELDSIVFMATNFNTMMESPLRQKAENIQMDILTSLFM